MTNIGKSLLAGLCALACANPALAQISVRTTMGNLTYTLTDLDPDDGITPSLLPLSSAPRASTSLVSTITQDGLRGQNIDQMVSGTMPLDPVAHAISYTSADGAPPTRLGASGSVSGGSLANLALEATADNNASAGDHIAASLAATDAAPFVLSPKTLIILSVDYELSETLGPLPLDAQQFSTYLTAGFHLLVAEEFGYQSIADGASYYGGSQHHGAPGQGSLRLAYANHESVGLTSYLSLNAWANATTNVPTGVPLPVPEPMTYAMLLAGLGIVVAARRRA